MSRFALDTSCMVAAVCTWHEHHERAAAELNRRLSARQTLVVPAPALIEAYAVLTRLPSPHRLSTDDARHLVEANFADEARLVTLNAADYVGVLRRAPDRGISGGRMYDAIIAQCAVKGRASCLLTFNERHFTSVADPGLEIVVP